MPTPRAKALKAEIAVARAISGRGRRRARPPRQIYPKGIQMQYARALRNIVREGQLALEPLLEALPSLVASAQNDRARLDSGEGKRVSELLEAANKVLARSLTNERLEKLAAKFAAQTSTWQRLQLAKETKAVLGVDIFAGDAGLTAAAEAFTAENVALIKNLNAKMYSDIEMLVTREVQAGALHKDIAKEIQSRFLISERRAKLIARDQVGKYYGKVTEVRQRNLGVEKFIWRTANDERVRDEHVGRDGQTYTWADAPEGGPGAPINCRCYAEPVFPDLD